MTNKHQGEPVAYEACGVLFKTLMGAKNYAGSMPITFLYTHADPGEVERLRGIIRMHEKTVREQADHLAYMRAQLAEANTAAEQLLQARDLARELLTRRDTKLAERDALLHEAINGKTRTQFDGDLMHRILMALSASAEPNNKQN